MPKEASSNRNSKGDGIAGCNGRWPLTDQQQQQQQLPLSLRSRPFIWPDKHLHWPFSVNIDRFPCKFNTQTFGAALVKLKISSVQSGRRSGLGYWPVHLLPLAHFEQLPNGKAINYWPVSVIRRAHTGSPITFTSTSTSTSPSSHASIFLRVSRWRMC